MYEQVNLYRELDFSIPELLKFRHIKYRFGRVLKELYPQLEAFAESSEDTILYKCHETDHYVTLIYFVPGPVSERIDAAFSSLQFERIILPDQYTGTPTRGDPPAGKGAGGHKVPDRPTGRQGKNVSGRIRSLALLQRLPRGPWLLQQRRNP
ncbi:MAG: hypothetical protein ACLUD2_20515 [Clostridium sp.]